MKMDMRKIYRFDSLPLAPGEPLPEGSGIFYECSDCKEVVSSVPFILVKCQCGNLEGRDGKLSIKDKSKVVPLKGVLK